MRFLLFIEHSAIEVDTYLVYLFSKGFFISNGDWLFNHTRSFIGLACATETIQNTKKRMRATIIRAGYQNTVWLIISRRFWAIFWRTFIVYELPSYMPSRMKVFLALEPPRGLCAMPRYFIGLDSRVRPSTGLHYQWWSVCLRVSPIPMLSTRHTVGEA